MTMKKLNRIILAFVLLLLLGAVGIFTLQPANSQEYLSNPTYWLVALALFFLIVGFSATYQALEAMKGMIAAKNAPAEAGETAEAAAETEKEEEPDWVDNVLKKLTDATPVEEEHKVATDHEYDGIRELDNNLPPWWLAGFYISIAFAVIYLLRYHVFQTAPLPAEEYRLEVAAAEEAKAEYLKTAANLVDESSVVMLTEESRLVAGGKIFAKNCAVCHAQDGGGGVGPNLTDAYWLHGNSISDIFKVVKYGVPAKGMVPWQDQLSPTQIAEVSSYIKSLEGSTPANPKDPQGDLVQEEAQEEEAPAETTEEEGSTTEEDSEGLTSL